MTTTSKERVAITPAIDAWGQGDLVEMHIHNRLSRADYDKIVPVLKQLAEQHGQLRYLVFLEDFHGWTPAAFWDELKFDVKNRSSMGRIAVVGATALQRAAGEAARAFIPAPVAFFDREEEAAARTWIGQWGGPRQ